MLKVIRAVLMLATLCSPTLASDVELQTIKRLTLGMELQEVMEIMTEQEFYNYQQDQSSTNPVVDGVTGEFASTQLGKNWGFLVRFKGPAKDMLVWFAPHNDKLRVARLSYTAAIHQPPMVETVIDELEEASGFSQKTCSDDLDALYVMRKNGTVLANCAEGNSLRSMMYKGQKDVAQRLLDDVSYYRSHTVTERDGRAILYNVVLASIEIVKDSIQAAENGVEWNGDEPTFHLDL